jgi:hypothetical protein
MSVKVSFDRETFTTVVGELGCHQLNLYLLENPCPAYEYLADGLEMMLIADQSGETLKNCEVSLVKETYVSGERRMAVLIDIEGGANLGIYAPFEK